MAQLQWIAGAVMFFLGLVMIFLWHVGLCELGVRVHTHAGISSCADWLRWCICYLFANLWPSSQSVSKTTHE